ncbi:hypothetical protein [Longispora albida]|uniref:hypothetical protein n=1 Tax=Longispora albida TaxID=203523 RepID=UPI0003703654|nr:hypothetical protein [Longispora albida]
MTYDLAAHPVEAAPEIMSDLLAHAGIDTLKLTAYAQSLGVVPPDERDRWKLCMIHFPDGREPGLYWVHPDDEEDEDE